MTNRTLIIKMWKEGKTSGEIARSLKLSRNQVMGAVFRAQKRGELSKKTQTQLSLIRSNAAEKRNENKPRKTVNQILVARKQANTHRIKEVVVMPNFPKDPLPKTETPKTGRRKTLLELNMNECRWVNDDKTFCAEPTVSESTSWCCDHYKIVYAPSAFNTHKSDKYKRHILTIAKKYDQIKD